MVKTIHKKLPEIAFAYSVAWLIAIILIYVLEITNIFDYVFSIGFGIYLILQVIIYSRYIKMQEKRVFGLKN
ncbi:hypothetical protein U6A24_10950 [Aquimarina gracilis]|uniref:Uncharacterized protein n=1 Tax=Aquimarina gracilis TaxID=874422 RepID=A0ABU5ZVV7_9FLAO|nr:hypothetical protein [Aquimarina gracilis]MEB3345982.1 hypothetical protein [Aquimarina gracilis]